MDQVATIVLAGGKGTRLAPLTTSCCKPAIPFGGKYRLIDVPLSNSLHSNINKIFILTQYLSASLHEHLFDTYRLGECSKGYVKILAAEQKPEKKRWYEGTADAVRQNLDYLKESDVEYFLILSGDQLYNFDFEKFVNFAAEKQADLTIASLPIDSEEAKRMGVMQVNSEWKISDFHEKPQEKQTLEKFICSSSLIDKSLVKSEKACLASMGIYLFKRDILIDLLERDLREDFGKHLIPSLIQTNNVYAYPYTGYWEDIGTIRSFFEANIALTQKKPLFDLYESKRPLYSRSEPLPPSNIENTLIKNAIISEGCMIEADELSYSIIGKRSVIKKGTIIRNSYLIGNDTPKKNQEKASIGESCILQNCIIDKNATIEDHVQLINKKNLQHYDLKESGIYIRDGIIIVTKGAIVPKGFVL